MDLPRFIQRSASLQIKTIEMHTTGEPTRIVYSGFPDLPGTLLEQRALAQSEYDHIRRALVCEPRGHRDMYGAVLCPRTELIEAGQAHMGVLFLTNSGYSTMCGHATLALGRLLVDCAGSNDSGLGSLDVAKKIPFDEKNKVAHVNLHAPCGLVHVTVPITRIDGVWCTDTAKPISYLSVPSYATAISTQLDIPTKFAWPELANVGPNNNTVVFDVSYGGAFYIVIPVTSLGFQSLQSVDFKALSNATAQLKAAFNAPRAAQLRALSVKHPDHRDLEFLYGVIVTEPDADSQGGAENGLCFFADGQVDRSPTGSGVQARVALAIAKGERKPNEPSMYHSPVSKAFNGEDAFSGEAVKEVKIGHDHYGVVVKVSGWAKYTGCCNFVIEENDEIGNGFWFDDVIKSDKST